MDYFAGIHFLHQAEVRRYDYQVDDHHDYFAIQYHHAGALRHRVDEGPWYDYDGAWVFRTFPGPRFRYGSAPGTVRHHAYVAFAGPRAERMVAEGLLVNDPTPLRVSRPAVFLRGLRELHQAVMANDEALAVHRLEGLLLDLQHLARPLAVTPAGITELAERIRAKPQRDWDLAAEARRTGISTDHLRRMFARTHGRPLWRYILDRRLDLAAARLCDDADSTLVEVARACGFHDAQHLQRHFVPRFAMTPGAYRRAFGRSGGDLYYVRPTVPN